MLFNKIKNKLYSKTKSAFSSPGSKKDFASSVTTVPGSSRPNPVVSAAYHSYKNAKIALANFDTVKSEYNPLQLKEQADDSGFDPYFSIGTQETISIPENEDDGDYQKIDKLQDASDKTKGMNNTDKTEDMNNNTDETTEVYYDAFETIVTADTTGTTHTTDTAVPVSERLFSAATSTASSVASNALWGAMTAAHFVNNGKKAAKNYCKDINKRRNSPPPSQCHPLFDDRSNDGASVIRSYGVDFPYPAIFDKIPFMKSKTNASETRIFELRCDERKLYERRSGKHTKRPIDENWGFIESGYTVQFKPTRSSVQKPPTESPAINEEQPNTSPDKKENLGSP